MTRRHIRVAIESRYFALINGHGSRDLLSELMNGRPPVWSTRHKAWTCSERTARTLIALAEHHGYDVTVTGPLLTATTLQHRASERLRELTEPTEEADLWT